ncbi:MAG: ATP-dependent DNA helicase [Syntrophomonadaceae bacterium]|jgi:ATP-dependent DNA helicase DinG
MDKSYFDQVMYYIGSGGLMEKAMPGFVNRMEQVHMAGEVSRALNEEMFLAAEVGTGVGKTYAYLVPAIIWAVNQKEKVVISTRTKALQQQLTERDLPDLQTVLEFEFKFAEAKGRENFLCWNKYQRIISGRQKLDSHEEQFITAVLSWAERTRTGDNKELAISGDLMAHWPILASDRRSCMNTECRYRDKCFRLKMMKRLEKADIIVVNNALLLADMIVDNSILPEYHYLVLDEAHSFNREAFDKLSNRFSLNETVELYYWLHNQKGRSYLYYLKNRFPQYSSEISEINHLVERGIELTQNFFTSINQVISYPGDFSFTHIIENRSRDNKWYEEAFPLYQNWRDNNYLLIKKLEDLSQGLTGEEESELTSAQTALSDIGDKLYYLMEEDIGGSDKIAWIEYIKGKAISVCSSVINTGELIDNLLYSKLKSLIMVSATLTVEDQFNYFIDRNGLSYYAQNGRFLFLLEKSPFDYEKNACLYVLSDMPDPNTEKFDEAVKQTLDDIISSLGGRIMILFTSRKQLNDVASYLRPRCEQNSLKLLVQGEDGSFGTLINEFISSPNAVLMGVETFWEGIDLKGDVLKCLVIVKLPFRAPTEPYCSAADKYCRANRQSSFMNFTLPDATVRFKQGVGRLIRSEADSGIVIVLDTRLINRPYGPTMTNSIPIQNIKTATRASLKQLLK